MSAEEKLNRLRGTLVADWSLSTETRPTMSLLLEALAKRVQILLDDDFNKLTTAMYTLDISEERFSAAMNIVEFEEKSTAIADLILQREIQKMESRMRYEEMKQRDASEGDSTPELQGDSPALDQD
jgi:hypothetical protein